MAFVFLPTLCITHAKKHVISTEGEAAAERPLYSPFAPALPSGPVIPEGDLRLPLPLR